MFGSFEGIELINLGGAMDIALSGDSGGVTSPAAMMPQCRGGTMEAKPAPAGPKLEPSLKGSSSKGSKSKRSPLSKNRPCHASHRPQWTLSNPSHPKAIPSWLDGKPLTFCTINEWRPIPKDDEGEIMDGYREGMCMKGSGRRIRR